MPRDNISTSTLFSNGRYIRLQIIFLYLINNQDATHLWQAEEYYFTNVILSCPLGVFGAVFQSPPSQQLLLRGPVSWFVGSTMVTAHAAGYLTESFASSHEYEVQDFLHAFLCFHRDFPLSLLAF